jgi:group II intron reverse transcriptase/maturase
MEVPNGQRMSNTLFERVLSRENMIQALGRVRRNHGSHGVDGMTVDELPAYLESAWPFVKEELLTGTYTPQPVRRVEIPKPDGGTRLLGIPTVFDRLIQQAIAQTLSVIFEGTFSESSYGFRPGKGAHGAVFKAREYIEQGHTWVVDIDLEKFFDRVNHDILMSRIARKVKDRRVLGLVRKYLEAGVLINGVKVCTEEGTPQGGPLSPLLANILLDDLDKELEKRGHVFVRYADDCNIYVKSERAGKRVMQGVRKIVTETLRLKVNESKSSVDRPWKRKFLGFSFYCLNGGTGIRIHPKSIRRFRATIRKVTNRNHSRNFEERLERLAVVTGGWINYFGIAEAKKIMETLDGWIRRRLRACLWKQWKRIKTKHDNLVRLGVNSPKAWEWANTRKKCWRISCSFILSTTVTNEFLEDCGYKSLVMQYRKVHYV